MRRKKMEMDIINYNAAGIDIGSRSHFVAVGQALADVKDCRWIQQLHTLGLLSSSFLPDETTEILRYLLPSKKQLD